MQTPQKLHTLDQSLLYKNISHIYTDTLNITDPQMIDTPYFFFFILAVLSPKAAYPWGMHTADWEPLP